MTLRLLFAKFFFCLFFLVFPGLAAAASPQKQPNFIVILLDDFGLHDAGFMGNDFIETPAMDKLAKEGVVFTQAYSNAPNCAPSRAAIMSGQYAPRTGVYTMVNGDMGESSKRQLKTPKNNMFLPESVYTLAELLRDHGYATAQIGKWNLGHGAVRGPEGQGFDVNIGGHRGGVGESYFAPYSKDLPGLDKAPAGEYLTDRLNAEAIKFVDANRAKPFFMYLSHYAPHFPIQAPGETVKKYTAKRAKFCGKPPTLKYCEMSAHYPEYAAMLEHVDRGLDRLRAALQANGLADNTIIVLLSDNGGYTYVQDPQALSGQKSQLYEGGIRVPMVWFLPGVQLGRSTDVPVSGLDIYPTFAALAGIDVKKQVLDGEDVSPLLRNLTTAGHLSQRALYWYFPAYTLDNDTERPDEVASSRVNKHFSQVPAVGMLRDGWKLIRYYDGAPPELYYLPNDPLEKNNRFIAEKKRGTEMMRELENWLQKTGGALALPANPDYRP